MKRKLYFCEYVMRDILIYGLLIGIIFFAIEQFSFMLSFSPGVGVRFSTELDEANFRIIFISAAIVMMAAFVWCVARRFIGSKGIYGLCMAPVSYKWLLFSWIAAGVIVLTVLVLFRYLSVLTAYAQYKIGTENFIADKIASGVSTSASVEQGALFTAYLRCDHLRIFLPYTFKDGAMLFFTLVSLPVLMLRFALSIFAKKLVSGSILSVLWILFFILFGELEFLGFIGLAVVSVWSFLSAKSMIKFGQML